MEKDNTSLIIYYIACLTVLLLFVSQYMIIGVGIIALLNAYIIIKQKSVKIPKVCAFFFIFIIINFVQTLFISNSEAIQEIERNIIYLLMITLLFNIKIPYKSFLKIWKAMLFFCFLIQVMQFLNLFSINEILERIYGYSIFLKVAGYSSIRYFRSGSIFVSINPYFKFTAVTLAILFYDLNRKDGNRFTDYVFITITFISTLFCGSRTGFVVIAFLCMMHLLSGMSTKAETKSIVRVVGVAIGFVIVFVFLNQWYNVADSRLLNAEDSLTYKFFIIKKFITIASSGELFFGMGAYTAANSGLNMDSDLGFMLSYYGIIGVIVYYFMFFALVNIKHSTDNAVKLYLKMIFIVLLLSGTTSGVYFNYRVFSTILLALIPFQTAFISEEHSMCE